jgi:hypothetical protein
MADKAASKGEQAVTTPTPSVTEVQPPKMEGRGKTAIHSPEFIAELAKGAATGWRSNGLSYKTKSGAQGACQTVKEAIVSQGHAKQTSDLTARVWQNGEGEYVFAIAAKAAVR